MRRVVWTARFLVGVRLVLPFFPVIPIVIEVKTQIHVFEGILWHAFHARADRIERFLSRPTILDQRIASQTPRELTSEKASNVVGSNILLVGGTIVFRHPPFRFDDVQHVIARASSPPKICKKNRRQTMEASTRRCGRSGCRRAHQ
jgi:hypothetical protein